MSSSGRLESIALGMSCLFLFMSCAGATELRTDETRVLFILAHPDDEIFFSGTIAKLASARVDLKVLYTTSGSAGENKHLRGVRRNIEKSFRRIMGITSGLVRTPLTSGTLLARMREREARQSLLALGVKRQPLFLRFRDGHTFERYFALAARLQREITSFAPELVFGFSLDGITGHRDHVTAAAATLVALQQVRRSIPLFGGVMPETRATYFRPFWRFKTVREEQLDLRVSVRGTEDARARAFRAHRSQFRVHDMSIYAGKLLPTDGEESYVALFDASPLPTKLSQILARSPNAIEP